MFKNYSKMSYQQLIMIRFMRMYVNDFMMKYTNDKI